MCIEEVLRSGSGDNELESIEVLAPVEIVDGREDLKCRSKEGNPKHKHGGY